MRGERTKMTSREILEEYLSQTSIHGLKYVAKGGLHWIERLFWLVVCTVSWLHCILIIIESWMIFQNNPISFVVETDFLWWNASFPAVSVCEEDNMDQVFKFADEFFGEEHDYNLDEVIREIAYFRGETNYITAFCKGLPCPQNGLKNIAKRVRSPCENVFESCQWNEKPFDCCSEFKPIETEVGTCYTANTVQASGEIVNNFMISNRDTGPGILKIKIKVQSKVYLHSPEDVPFLNSQESLITEPYSQSIKRFSIREVHNGEEVKDISAEKRRCKFSFEREDETPYPHYSYSACVVHCRVLQEKRVCNCTPPLTPNSPHEDTCNLTGILCLSENFGTLSVLKSKWNSVKDGLSCPCLPNCEEIEINTIEEYVTRTDEKTRSVQLILDRIPSERYQRKVVHGKLDLAVALGGSCGLFVGASLLSAVELLYYLAIKPWSTRGGDREGGKRKETGSGDLKRKAACKRRIRKYADITK